MEDKHAPSLSSADALATATALAGENMGSAQQNAALATQVADLATYPRQAHPARRASWGQSRM